MDLSLVFTFSCGLGMFNKTDSVEMQLQRDGKDTVTINRLIQGIFILFWQLYQGVISF